MIEREAVIKNLKSQIASNFKIVGVAAGNGMTAKYCVMGGADFILALSSGKFRQMGRSSLAGLLCYSNSNEIVMEFASRELMPIIPKTPIIFGLHATDPTINLYDYLNKIKMNGFAGINNFPSIGLIDGTFRLALEEQGVTFASEVEAIRLASFLNLFTVAFVFNEEQAYEMVKAGADVICAHFGLTGGGYLGAKKVFSLEHAKIVADQIFTVADSIRPECIKMIYGGPASSPFDMLYLYTNTSCDGYIGGSSFERIPTEKAILATTKSFKNFGSFAPKDLMHKTLDDNSKSYDLIGFVKTYISQNYSNEILLSDLASAAHVSTSYLSTKFKKETGYSFTEYLITFRIDKAVQIMKKEKIHFLEVASMVGYRDYAQFSKIFKKYKGVSPKQFTNDNISTS